MNITKITENEFFNTYKPITNHINPNAPFDGCMFETYGEEFEYVVQM